MRNCIFILMCLLGLSAYAQMDHMFYYPNKTIKTMDSVDNKEIILEKDSVKLSCVYFKANSKPKATILFFHGSGGNISTYLFMIKPLVKNGYNVFAIDFRGYGNSTGKPTHLNIASDAQFIMDYVLRTKEISNHKLIVYGASMGTQIAAKVAHNYKDKIIGVVLDGALSSFTDIAATRVPPEQKAMIESKLVSPYSAKEEIKLTGNIKKLFIHSKEDKDVPFEQGKIVFENAPQPKEFLIYEGPHLEALSLNTQAVIEKIDAFLKK